MIRDLAEYLDPKNKITIGESVTRIEEGEPFCHPDFVDILTYLRGRFPRTPIHITTNGSLLTEQVIDQLAQIGHIELNLSLNSCTLLGRQRLMHDCRASIAVKAPQLLAAYGLPYHGSVVGMPQIVGWGDISSTCHYLEEMRAQTIGLFIPSFTRYAAVDCQYSEDWLQEFVHQAQLLAGKLSIPLILEPFMPNDLSAVLEGVLKNSPADHCGLKKGDIIHSVNGKPVRSRVDAFQALMAKRHALLEVKRGTDFKRVNLQRNEFERPGIVMYNDIDFSLVDRLRQIVAAKQAACVAVLTSSLAFSLWKSVLSDMPNAYIYEVPSRFFGGTIKAAGLLTVTDYQYTIIRLAQEIQPDIIFLPQISFDAAGHDLTGSSYLALDTNEAEIILL